MSHSTIFFGTTAIPIQAPAQQSKTTGYMLEEEVTTAGRKIIFTAPRGHREWKITLPTKESSALALLESLTYLPPSQTFYWVPCDALTKNMLTPGQSLMENADQGGIYGGSTIIKDSNPVIFQSEMVCSYSWVISSSSTNTTLTGRKNQPAFVPAFPGQAMTASVLAQVAIRGTIFFAWHRGDGSQIKADAQAISSTGGQWEKVSITRQAPDEAAFLRVIITGAQKVAALQVTLTSSPVKWDLGKSAEKVILIPGQTDTILIEHNRGQVLETKDFTVKEVG